MTSMPSALEGPHAWLGAHAAMSSALVGVMVATWKRATPSDLLDDRVGEAAQGGELLVERLGVRTGSVRVAEADDGVGDAGLLQAPDAVRGVGVDRDGVDRERP